MRLRQERNHARRRHQCTPSSPNKDEGTNCDTSDEDRARARKTPRGQICIKQEDPLTNLLSETQAKIYFLTSQLLKREVVVITPLASDCGHRPSYVLHPATTIGRAVVVQKYNPKEKAHSQKPDENVKHCNPCYYYNAFTCLLRKMRTV